MKHAIKNVLGKLAGTGILAVTLISCGANPSKSGSEVKVTNGREIAETDYPSVVLLVLDLAEGQAICTGTFINDSQLLTAGHCVEGLTAGDPKLYVVGKKLQNGKESFYARAKALSFQRNPRYSIELGVSPYDMSIVNFPANSAPAISALATAAPRAGDSLTIVGYGNNVNSLSESGELTGSGSTVKRVGTNQVGDLSGGFINFNGLPSANDRTVEGQLVSSGSGDSGGPLFVNGKLAGVTSGGGLQSDGKGGYTAVSKYVSVNSGISQSFLATAIKSSKPL